MITGRFEGLSDAWERAAPAAVRCLERRGVSRTDAEDAVQDAGVRALTRGLQFENEEHVRRWLTLVAWRAAVDGFRRKREVGPVAEFATDEDPSVIVEQRDAANAVMSAVGRLREADRAALLGPTATGLDRTTAVKLNVRRHRARQRLLVMVEGFLGWWLWTRDYVHRMGRARLVAVPVAAVAAMLIMPHFGLQQTEDQPALTAGQPPLAAPTGHGAVPVRSLRAAPAAVAFMSPTEEGASHGRLLISQEVREPRPVVALEIPTPTGDPLVGGIDESGGEPELCAFTPYGSPCVDIAVPPTAGTPPSIPAVVER